MGIGQFIAHEVELADRHFDQKGGQNLSRYLIVVNIKFGEISVLNGINKLLSSTIVDLIVLELDLLQSLTPSDQVTDHDTAL